MKRTALFALAISFSCATAAVVLQPHNGAAQEPPTPAAQDKPTYVGTQACVPCHKEVYEKWLLTPHRRTLEEGRKPELSGCEACHGPGSAHVAKPKDKTKVVRLIALDSKTVSDTCFKCHKQAEVMHFRTGPHAAAKIKCIDCHDPHSNGSATMLRDVDAKQNSLRGLVAEIKDAEQREDIAATPKERDAAAARVMSLSKKKDQLTKEMDSPEYRERRPNESELCLSCHKTQQAQFNQPTHHAIPEGKMQCSSCHNPHGGPRGNLRGETVNETCIRCHAEIPGPYVFQHPPVEEDCTICHKPHGSTNRSLLKQTEPFLCLKCHAGPHTRGAGLTHGDDPTTTSRIPTYYWQCTSCHVRIHGSDRHGAFHF